MSRRADVAKPTDLLACSVCLTKHPAHEFGLNTQPSGVVYYSFCRAAQRQRSRMATWYTDNGIRRRRYPTHAQVRAAMGNTTPVPAAVKNKSAGHVGQRNSLPRTAELDHALGVIRDHKAQSAGKQGYVYLIVEDLPGGALVYGKVGYSTNPAARVAELQTGNPRKLRLHLSKPGTEADEATIHAKYAHKNVLQEWFTITKELLLEWDAEHQIKPAAQSGGTTQKEVTSA